MIDPAELVNDWIDRLHSLVANCAFGKRLDGNIIDCIVGMNKVFLNKMQKTPAGRFGQNSYIGKSLFLYECVMTLVELVQKSRKKP